ncbi:MAG TPA: transposase [Bacteroidota bacterium]|nr:transposase [Bacteroidota bacterium]
MSRTRYKIYNEGQPHFLTATIVEWIPLFTNPDITSLVLDSLRFLQRERRVALYAYVIMEHHFHQVASSPELKSTVKEFKSFTARKIIDYVQDRGFVGLLEKLHDAREAHKRKSEYQVWQEGSHPQEIYGEKMLIQKIDYTHDNLIRRDCVYETRHWRYSSARNYEGTDGLLRIKTDWRNEG